MFPAFNWILFVSKVKTISSPTRVMHGTADTLIDVSGGERTAAVIPNADLVLIDGWGHDLPPGSWPQVTQAIVEHIENLKAE